MKKVRLVLGLIMLSCGMMNAQWVPIGELVIWTQDVVGIGATNPVSLLEVSFSGTNGITITGDNTGDARLSIRNGLGDHFIFDDHNDGHSLDIESANALNFNSGGDNERMRISSNGNISMDASTFFVDALDNRIGIGTSAPEKTLDVIGDGQFSGNSSYINFKSAGPGKHGLRLYDGNTFVGGVFMSEQDGEINISNNATASGLTVDMGNNRIGIGVSNPAFELQVSGNVDITGELTAASDFRLKKNIEPVNNALATVSMLNPVLYNFRTDEFPDMELPDRRKMGLIAQEVENVLPELVVEAGTQTKADGSTVDIKSVNYMEMVPLLIKATQELTAELSEKDAEIQALRKEMAEIRAMIESK